MSRRKIEELKKKLKEVLTDQGDLDKLEKADSLEDTMQIVWDRSNVLASLMVIRPDEQESLREEMVQLREKVAQLLQEEFKDEEAVKNMGLQRDKTIHDELRMVKEENAAEQKQTKEDSHTGEKIAALITALTSYRGLAPAPKSAEPTSLDELLKKYQLTSLSQVFAQQQQGVFQGAVFNQAISADTALFDTPFHRPSPMDKLRKLTPGEPH